MDMDMEITTKGQTDGRSKDGHFIGRKSRGRINLILTVITGNPNE